MCMHCVHPNWGESFCLAPSVPMIGSRSTRNEYRFDWEQKDKKKKRKYSAGYLQVKKERVHNGIWAEENAARAKGTTPEVSKQWDSLDPMAELAGSLRQVCKSEVRVFEEPAQRLGSRSFRSVATLSIISSIRTTEQHHPVGQRETAQWLGRRDSLVDLRLSRRVPHFFWFPVENLKV